jgi:hypothetical protein
MRNSFDKHQEQSRRKLRLMWKQQIEDIITRLTNDPLYLRLCKLKDHHPFCKEIGGSRRWNEKKYLDVSFKPSNLGGESKKSFFVQQDAGKERSFSYGDVSRDQEKEHVISELQNHKNWLDGYRIWTDFSKNDSFRDISQDFVGIYDQVWLLNIFPKAVSFVDTDKGTKVATCYIIARGSKGQCKGKWSIFFSQFCGWDFLMCERLKYDLIKEFNETRYVTADNRIYVIDNLMAMGNINTRYNHQTRELYLCYIQELDSPPVYGKILVNNDKERHKATSYLEKEKSFPLTTLPCSSEEASLYCVGDHSITLNVTFPGFVTNLSRKPQSITTPTYSMYTPISVEKNSFVEIIDKETTITVRGSYAILY